MPEHEIDEWLEDKKLHTTMRLKRMKEHVAEIELELKYIETLSEFREQNRELQESNDATRAENDQLEAELRDLRAQVEI